MMHKIHALLSILIINAIVSINGMENKHNKLIQVMPIVQKLFDEKVIERFPCHSPNETNLNIFFTLKKKQGIIDQDGILVSELQESELIDLIKSIKGFFSLKKELPKSEPIKDLNPLIKDSKQPNTINQAVTSDEQKDAVKDAVNDLIGLPLSIQLKKKSCESDKSTKSIELLISANKGKEKRPRKMSQSSDALMPLIDDQIKTEIVVGSLIVPSSPSIALKGRVQKKNYSKLPESDDESQNCNKDNNVADQICDVFDMEL